MGAVRLILSLCMQSESPNLSGCSDQLQLFCSDQLPSQRSGQAPAPAVASCLHQYRCRKHSAAANTYTHFMDASHHHWELNESKSPLELQELLRHHIDSKLSKPKWSLEPRELLRHRIVWHCQCQVPHNRIECLLTARRQHRLWPAAQHRRHLVPECFTRPQLCSPIERLRCTPRFRAHSTF